MNNENSNYIQPRFPRKTPPGYVFSTWEIHYVCNYRCTYCHAPKPWHPDARKAAYLDVKKWSQIWHDLYERYGSWYILISGGEPFVYADFMKLIIELSRLHFIEICTNLSWEVEQFIKHMDPGMTKISTSFHPEFASLDKFIAKTKLLKDSGFNPIVNFVPWPPLLPRMSEYKEKVEQIGVPFVLQPFIGDYGGRRYPQGYTESEREYFKIFKDGCNTSTLNFKTTAESNSTNGKACRMGENYAFIHPDGEAHRCCKDKSFSLGNIIAGSFRLLDEPVACVAQECNCWRCMLVGKEEEWSRHWSRPDQNPGALSRQDKQNHKTDIILIQPPVWGISEPPVAIAQLSACLKQKGYKVLSRDLNIRLFNNRKEEYQTLWAIEQSMFWNNRDNVSKFFQKNNGIIEDFINEIILSSADFACFSVNTCSLLSTFEIARRLKEKNPDIKIILGGPMFLVCEAEKIDAILRNEYIDIVVFGEGEKTLIELLGALIDNRDPGLCKGICFKRSQNIVRTQPRPMMDELDELPFLDFSDLPLEQYDRSGHLGRHISLMSSRGCLLNCVFCGPRAYWPGYRAMSGKRIYEEIKYHVGQNPGIEYIDFLDLLFNGNIPFLEEFCGLMISAPIKQDLKWHANVIIRKEMTAELLRKVRKAGCFHLTYGIESGSQHVLGLMNKRYRLEDADKVLKYTHESGILVTCNFMFGFPGETECDFQETMEFIKRNREYIDFAYPSRTFCTIEPYSYLAKHLEQFSVVPNATHGQFWESGDGKNTYPERMRRCEQFSSLAGQLGINVGLGLQTSLEQDHWLNLGDYYESKKDYINAIDCYNRYLNLDSKNEIIQDKIARLKDYFSEKKQINQKILFNWDIHYVCNYRCPYCWFYAKWPELRGRNRYFPKSQLINFWKNIYSKYGEVKIAITGGEPFLYPEFTELIEIISRIHEIEIITNLSTEIEPFLDRVSPKSVKIHPSFHPLFAGFEDFKEKILKLRQKGFSQNPSFLAWPPQVNRIKYYYDKFSEFGINLFVQPFFGEYKGMRYPDNYSDIEKEMILPFIGERGNKPFQIEPLKTEGKLCSAGHRYGVIHPDGAILRCGGISSTDSEIGNLADNNFELLKKPFPCSSQICPCNEWAFLLEEK